MSYDQAATIPFCLSAAAFGLYSPLSQGGLGLTPAWLHEGRGKYRNLSIVVLGGASSVGKYTIQLARESGFYPIVTTASVRHHALLRSLGATHVLDRASPELSHQIEKVFLDVRKSQDSRPRSPTKPILSNGLPTTIHSPHSHKMNGLADVVFDALSLPETRHLALQISNPCSGAVVYSLPPPEDVLNPASVLKRKVVTPCALPERQPEVAAGLFAALSTWLKLGVIKVSPESTVLVDRLLTVLKPNKHRVIPGGITAIPHGLQLLEARKYGGCKLIVNP